MGRKKKEDVVNAPCDNCNEDAVTEENNVDWDRQTGELFTIKVTHFACSNCGYLHRVV